MLLLFSRFLFSVIYDVFFDCSVCFAHLQLFFKLFSFVRFVSTLFFSYLSAIAPIDQLVITWCYFRHRQLSFLSCCVVVWWPTLAVCPRLLQLDLANSRVVFGRPYQQAPSVAIAVTPGPRTQRSRPLFGSAHNLPQAETHRDGSRFDIRRVCVLSRGAPNCKRKQTVVFLRCFCLFLFRASWLGERGNMTNFIRWMIELSYISRQNQTLVAAYRK